MDYKTVLAYAAGLILIAAFAFVMRLKTRGIVRLLVNSLAGGAVIFGLGFFGTAVLPLNPLNALLTGLLGIPGLVAVFLLCRFL